MPMVRRLRPVERGLQGSVEVVGACLDERLRTHEMTSTDGQGVRDRCMRVEAIDVDAQPLAPMRGRDDPALRVGPRNREQRTRQPRTTMRPPAAVAPLDEGEAGRQGRRVREESARDSIRCDPRGEEVIPILGAQQPGPAILLLTIQPVSGTRRGVTVGGGDGRWHARGPEHIGARGRKKSGAGRSHARECATPRGRVHRQRVHRGVTRPHDGCALPRDDRLTRP